MAPCASDEVYHMIAKKCVPKSSAAGKILANPQNKRCKDDKVINPSTNRCIDPLGPTLRPVLMEGFEKAGKKQSQPKSARAKPTAAAQKTPLDLMMQYWKYHSYTSVFPRRKTYHDVQEEKHSVVNALVAVHRLFTSWNKNALKTAGDIRKAQPDFDKLQEFAKDFPKVALSPRRVMKSFTNIQRVEFEDPFIVTQDDFELVFRTILEKLLQYDISPKSTKKDAKKLAHEADYIPSPEGDVIIMH